QRGTLKMVASINACQSACYLVDIDGTITDYLPGRMDPKQYVAGNFLFPIICDLMVEQGVDRAEAVKQIAQLADRIVYWDYTDFIAEFDLPAEEAFDRMRAWHHANLLVYQSTVDFLKQLHNDGRKLYVMSNNPYVGCLLKLEVAGLAKDGACDIFTGIFGTNRVLGCKGDPTVWKRALAQLPFDPSQVGTIGDNPKEDGHVPKSLGIGESIILDRNQHIPSPGLTVPL
ncbi:MAG: HAD family hydrolase, partial [Phycisphaeraceae bacterium JB051]